ncbi:hypothetical protein Phpb_04072 [Photorhabdus namnaonensis]|uniref:Uncharacterized protein n=1 Tax=Photorhabdus namnaonensis TaxID=1851568 RepID=A0A1B8YD88_9GAMM|nr:hypothetical protein Phpb_04072 [Photorhabdus namnaonensis]
MTLYIRNSLVYSGLYLTVVRMIKEVDIALNILV